MIANEDIHIGIIGGLGKMGRWFHRFFDELGYQVSVADLDTKYTAEELAKSCQVVLVAVPLQEIGTHPLFGPGEPNITGQTVVLCPGRGQWWQEWLTRIFVAGGARVEVVSPEVHDYYMAVVQGLTHFSTLALGLTIDSLGIDLKNLKRFATPAFHRRLMEIGHLLSQKQISQQIHHQRLTQA